MGRASPGSPVARLPGPYSPLPSRSARGSRVRPGPRRCGGRCPAGPPIPPPATSTRRRRSPPPIPPDGRPLRAHIRKYGTPRTGGSSRPAGAGSSRTRPTAPCGRRPQEGPHPAQRRSPLGRRAYDLRHAAVSLWFNSGVPATGVAHRAGHSVAVLLKIYADCIDGQADAANERITDALDTKPDPGTSETRTARRHPEMAGQRQEAERDGRHNCSRRPVRGRSRTYNGPRRPGTEPRTAYVLVSGVRLG